MLKLFPHPQKTVIKEGFLKLENDFCVLFEYKGNNAVFEVVKYFCEECKKESNFSPYPIPDFCGKRIPKVKFAFDKTLKGEEYKLIVSDMIILTYGESVGAFRGVTTLLQLLQSSKNIPHLEIHDFPDIKHRGFMLDISRNKVPKLKEIFKLIDMLTKLKYNEFQLYQENLSFEYPAYPEYSKDIEGLTPYEMLQIVEYCEKRYIEVIPNQNSFGHLYEWLQKPEYKDVALVPGSFAIDPTDPKAIELLENIYNSLLPCFKSDYFNVGCDEVSDLESGKTKELCEKEGVAAVYLAHLLKLHEMLKVRGKRMIFWADIVFNHPETIEKLPKDIIPLVWNYEAETDFDPNSEKLSETGLDFYLCPGTSSWASVMGDVKKANANIFNAAQSCKKFNGRGVLLTDWGDAGHSQAPLVSYEPIVYCGGVCWSSENNEDNSLAEDYLDNFFFKVCEGSSFARLIYDASQILPKASNCTDPFLAIILDFTDFSVLERIEYEEIDSYIDKYVSYGEEVSYLHMNCEDSGLYFDEVKLSVELMKLLLNLFKLRYEKRDYGEIKDLDEKLVKLDQQIKDTKTFYIKTWAKRNHISGSEAFWGYISKQRQQIKEK